MATYVALLRAVNVSGSNRVEMARLRAAFVAAGHDDVVTHIQSGNVIFTSPLRAAAAQAHVESLIEDEFGLTVTAIMRTAKQLGDVCANNPFLTGEPDVSPLAVAFLGAAPATAAGQAFMDVVARTPDEVRLAGAHAYIRYANGAGTSKLTVPVWRKLGVESTARNWKVTNALAALAAGH